MSQRVDSTARTAPVRATDTVSLTDHGDLVVRVPASLVRSLAVVAVILAVLSAPFVVSAVVAVVAAMPLALVGVSTLLVGAFLAPFAGLVLVTVLLG